MKRCLIALLAIAALVAGCVPSVLPAVDGDTVVVVLGEPGQDLNPYSQRLANRQVGRVLFSGLFRTGTDLLPTPDLCRDVPTHGNGGISSDGLTIVYRLRTDVAWHDGTPVSAEDVVFTIQLQRDGKLVDESGIDYTVIESVKADGDAVVVRLAHPDAPLAWRLAPYIVPAHVLSSSGDIASDPYWLRPIGSGPYKVASSTPGASVLLAPVRGGGVSLDVMFTVDDADAADVFSSADVAIWPGSVAAPVGAEQAAEATVAPIWRTFVLNGDASHATANPAARRAVRALTAVAMAEDDASAGPFGFLPSVTAVSTITAEAEVNGDGWVRGADGYRSKSGTDLVIGVSAGSPSSDLGHRLDALAAGLESIGAHSTLDAAGTRFLGSFAEGGTLWGGQFDVAYVELPVGIPPGWGYPYSRNAVPSEARPAAPAFQRVSDPALDELGSSIAAAGSPEQAASLMREAFERAEEAAFVIWDEPVRARYLYRGLDGVAVHPVIDEALTTSGTWAVGTAER